MRGMWLSCLLLAGCATPELSNAGSRVHMADGDATECRPIATMREAEGGGLRSYEANRAFAETRLRNEAARLGANAVRVVEEVHGAADDGRSAFATGVAGLTTPNAGCTNCVMLLARAYACDAPPARSTPIAPASTPDDPPAAPTPVIAPVPAEPPVIIIIQPQK